MYMYIYYQTADTKFILIIMIKRGTPFIRKFYCQGHNKQMIGKSIENEY